MRVCSTVLAVAAAAAAGCGHIGGSGDGIDAGPGGSHDGGAGIDATSQGCGALTATFRDFRADHPDFEGALGDDRGLVKAMIGADRKPVFAAGGATATVAGPATFDQWYRDVDGVNLRFAMPLELTEDTPGHFVFDDQAFFPLDGLGWPGEEIDGHNFHFTTEVHSSFRYQGGEVFTFTGDDDVFVFVNDHLALDLGGVHSAESATIDFDAMAGALGLGLGGVYAFDVFHAERHTTASDFRVETSIACFMVP